MECSFLPTIGAKRANTLISLFIYWSFTFSCVIWPVCSFIKNAQIYNTMFCPILNTIQNNVLIFPPRAETWISCITDKHNEALDQEKTNAWKPDWSRCRQPRILGYKHRYSGEMERFDVSVLQKPDKNTEFSSDITANQIQQRKFIKYYGFLILLSRWRLLIIGLCVFW